VNIYEYGRSEINIFGKFSIFFNDLDVEDELSSLQILAKMANFCKIIPFEQHNHKLLSTLFNIFNRKIEVCDAT
jgi:hypothetical protein